MIKSDFIFKGKELIPLLAYKTNSLLMAESIIEKKIKEKKSQIILPAMERAPTNMFGGFKKKSEQELELERLEIAIEEVRTQKKKCYVLTQECKRRPRFEFVFDLAEAIWLHDTIDE